MTLAARISGINPVVMKWAREASGYSILDIAKSFKKSPEVIAAWEEGTQAPTYSQLERLAYTLYKRPLAIFFLPSPPHEEEINNSFRSLPEVELDALQPDTRYALRLARAMQISLDELLEGKNDGERLIFKELRINPGSDPVTVSRAVRNYLGVDISTQQKWKSTDAALKNWREVVEACGIFVFKYPFKQQGISGFCLSDREFPVIYLNNSTTKTRQIFSLFHELAHILFSTSGITKEDRSYVNNLRGTLRSVESFCNKFASEFLVPSEDFEKRIDIRQPVEKFSSKMANLYGVSREVILRKLLDRDLVSNDEYSELVSKWNAEAVEAKQQKKSGGDYFATQATYLGRKYLSLIFSKYNEGAITIEQLSEYARVKTRNVMGIEEYI